MSAKNNNKFNKAKNRSNLRIFSGSSHPKLAIDVSKKCGVSLGELDLKKFANNETSVNLKENVRAQDTYIIQTGGGSTPNDDLMELLFIINAFKLSSASAINIIIPYFFYSKGDQKDSHKRVPITAKLITTLLKKAGAHHVMIIEPHTPQLEGFFETPVDALKVEPLFCEWIRKNIKDWQECVVVAPDEGSVKRCISVANDLNLDFALITNRKPKDKKKSTHRRHHKNSTTNNGKNLDSGEPEERSGESAGTSARESESEAAPLQRPLSVPAEAGASSLGASSLQQDKKFKRQFSQPMVLNRQFGGVNRHKKISLSGSVSGRRVIVVDDMIDTGHTIKEAIETLKKHGAVGVYVMATHGIFSGNSVEIVKNNSDFIQKIVVSNTVPQSSNQAFLPKHLHVLDISGLIAEYIRRHHYRESVQVLCQYMPILDAETEEEGAEDDDNQTGSDESEEDPEELPNGENGANGSAANEAARDLRLMHLRKGFRLSSMCWDDNNGTP